MTTPQSQPDDSQTSPTPSPTETATPDTAETRQPQQPAPDEPSSSTGRDLVAMPTGSLAERIHYAQTLSTAGELIPKDLRRGSEVNVGKVLLIMETGGMLGIHPMAALNGVNVIEGKATISPALMSGLVRRAGHKLRVKTTGTVEGGDVTVTATLVRSDDPDEPFVATWTPHRAARAGLCTYALKGNVWQVTARSNSGKVLPWEAYTEALLKARAIGEVCREGAEDVLMGVHYTPEELGANVDADGAITVESTVTTLNPASEPEPSEEVVGAQLVAKAKGMPDVASVVGVWKSAPAIVAAHSWAQQYRDLMDWATRTVVAHPFNPSERCTVLEAFGAIRTHLEGGGENGAAPPAPAPSGAPAADDTVDATIEPEPGVQRPAAVEEIVDAEIIAPDEAGGDLRGTDADPWADGSAQAGQGLPDDAGSPHDAAAARVMAGLGGEVISDEAASAAERRRLEHEAQVADERRDSAEAAGKPPADTSGAGIAAVRAAREEIDRKNRERASREAAAAQTKGRKA